MGKKSESQISQKYLWKMSRKKCLNVTPAECRSLIVEVSVAAVLREVGVGEGAAGTVERVPIAVFLQ